MKSDERVIWTVDKGQDDITFLMRYLIAEPMRAALEQGPRVTGKVRHLAGPDATATSLGMTGPIRSTGVHEPRSGSAGGRQFV